MTKEDGKQNGADFGQYSLVANEAAYAYLAQLRRTTSFPAMAIWESERVMAALTNEGGKSASRIQNAKEMYGKKVVKRGENFVREVLIGSDEAQADLLVHCQELTRDLLTASVWKDDVLPQLQALGTGNHQHLVELFDIWEERIDSIDPYNVPPIEKRRENFWQIIYWFLRPPGVDSSSQDIDKEKARLIRMLITTVFPEFTEAIDQPRSRHFRKLQTKLESPLIPWGEIVSESRFDEEYETVRDCLINLSCFRRTHEHDLAPLADLPFSGTRRNDIAEAVLYGFYGLSSDSLDVRDFLIQEQKSPSVMEMETILTQQAVNYLVGQAGQQTA